MKLIPNHHPEPVENITQLITFLVRERGLTEADLQRVVECQRALELKLSEALLHLGIVTAQDLEAARRQPGAELPPESTGLASQSLLFVRDPFHAMSEQVRALRSELLRRQPDAQHNRIVVVSSNSADGRSSLAASLALACAQLGQRTLLVDADLRRPRQHELFALPRGPGLADTLSRGIAPAVKGIQGQPQLAVLTAGEAVSNPLELLCSKPFDDLLDSWRQTYRHVIIDSSAAERGADATAVASAAGAAVVLARLDHSSLPAGTELLGRLRNAQVTLLGSVVLGAAL